MRAARPQPRRGTIIPLLGCCLFTLFAFVALAIDLGMLAVSRTQSQNAADVAALVGTRTLNNKPGVANSNLTAAVAEARAVATGNPHLSTNFTAAQVSKIEVGQYMYDPASQTFSVGTWTDVTAAQTATPTSGSWTAFRITLAMDEPTYFMKVLGVNAMPSGAVAVAVYRPRDIAFALDMTGSMAYSSQFNSGNVQGSSMDNQSLNPDNLYPTFGHYANTYTKCRATTNQAMSSNEAAPQNNYSIATPAGPAIVRNFYFSASNISDPKTVATVGTKTVPDPSNPGQNMTVPDLLPAFHRWSPPEANADPANYIPPTYTFTGYNAFHKGNETSPMGPTPAPNTFATMTDTGTGANAIKYVGDRWRRVNGAIDKTNTNWTSGTTRAAGNAIELLGYNVSGGNVRGGTSGSTTIATEDRFRDPVWEKHGYDMDIPTYRTVKGNGNPRNPDYVPTLVAPEDRFQGYSMGPGYWGKTFFIWPPDPRWGNPNGGAPLGGSVNPASPGTYNVNNPAPKDSNGNYICDWRLRFFTQIGGATASTYWQNVNSGSNNNTVTYVTITPGTASLDTQGDNVPAGASAGGTTDTVNETLFNQSSGQVLGGTQTITTYNYAAGTGSSKYHRTTPTTSTSSQSVQSWGVNYTAVLKWIKSGPQTLPPNLRAGRVVYYSSIPDDVDTSTGSDAQKLDKVFWKNYIDYVLGSALGNGTQQSSGSGYSGSGLLYGTGDSWSAVGRNITSNATTAWTGPSGTWSSSKPYMRYNDSPNRPRLHFWFGPLSMMDFIGSARTNWNPGTCYEAQCWQLKAGMNSVLDDVRNNHPNDFVGMTMFSADHHNGIRVPMGQDFTTLKNALFYPKSLLADIKNGDQTKEYRPYNLSFNPLDLAEIPNANGSTDPNTGLAYAYNLLSPSSQLNTTVYGTVKGRRGASKIVIFETDGVPNTYRSLTFNQMGYDSYYTVGASSGNIGNGNDSTENAAYAVVQQIVMPMSTKKPGDSGYAAGTHGNSGLSLSNAPARVYPIAFGDLFDTTLAPNATYRDSALAFLAKCAEHGKTGQVSATTLPSHQIITGTSTQRIDRLKDCMQRIFQSGVSVTLIE